MNTVVSGIEISSVNIEDRKGLGLRAGDTVRVHQKIEDKGKTRIQMFEGLVLARKHGSEAGATFTVRKVVDGIGVEKIFPLFSPLIDKIEIVRRSTVRQSKIYYIREKVAREIRRQMRRMRLMDISSESDIETKADADKVSAEDGEGTPNQKKEVDESAVKEAKEANATETSEETVAETPSEDTPTEKTQEESPESESNEEEKPEEAKEEKKD